MGYGQPIFSKKMGYNCGPSRNRRTRLFGWYIVRPCVNALGLGLGAEKVWLEQETMHHSYGYFWCEWFEGEHFSVDFHSVWK